MIADVGIGYHVGVLDSVDTQELQIGLHRRAQERNSKQNISAF